MKLDNENMMLYPKELSSLIATAGHTFGKSVKSIAILMQLARYSSCSNGLLSGYLGCSLDGNKVSPTTDLPEDNQVNDNYEQGLSADIPMNDNTHPLWTKLKLFCAKI